MTDERETRQEPVPEHETGVTLTEEQRRRQRTRSIVIGLTLAALVILFYVVTVVKLGPQVLDRPL